MALPQPPTHLLAVREYAQLGEDTQGRTELQEGNLVMSPSPSPNHMAVTAHLLLRLVPQLPTDLEALPDLDIDLDLVPGDQPGSSRRPDLIIVQRSARRRSTSRAV